VQKGGESTDVAVKTCKLDDEYETAEKFLEEARKSFPLSGHAACVVYVWRSVIFSNVQHSAVLLNL